MTKFYVTTPIYYVNDQPHIGHAYTSIIADVFARFERLAGSQAYFLTGTDEHGQKIARSAERLNIDCQTLTNQFAKKFESLSQQLNLSNDDFIRTTEKRHIEYVTTIWKKLESTGHIYLSNYSGWYSVRDEAFYSDFELVDGKAPTGADVEWLEEESYFFKLASFQDHLLLHYKQNPDFIKPESRRAEVISFVKQGLKDLSISRTTFSWGIPVPGNAKHVIYVWLDALFNYASALGSNFSKFWPCDLQLVGKDILRFHAVYWPAFLMAAELPLPKTIFAHGWWTNEGIKISKSLGNTIDPLELVAKFGLDYVRYFLVRAMQLGSDGSFSTSNFIQLINTELVNNVGNLVQRFISFVNKNCSNCITVPEVLPTNTLLEQVSLSYETYLRLMKQHNLHGAVGAIVNLATAANVYIDAEKPWSLKDNHFALEPIIYSLFEAIRVLAILLIPVIPESASKILDLLNVDKRDLESATQRSTKNVTVNQAAIIFPRIQQEDIVSDTATNSQ